jgi:hypothetical protein
LLQARDSERPCSSLIADQHSIGASASVVAFDQFVRNKRETRSPCDFLAISVYALEDGGVTMILANTRLQMTRDDAQLAVRLLARVSGEPVETIERRITDDGLDAVLDDPLLTTALMQLPAGAHASLPLFAYAMIRHALRNAGEDDRGIADYVTSIVVHFSLGGRANRIGMSDDQTYQALVDLAGDVDDPDANRSFLVRTHLGNYALWLSGLFPDHIEQRRWRRGGPDLEYFEELGSKGFSLASEHRLAEQYGLTALYATAAERFGLLRSALNNVSDALFFPNVNTPERLMRIVKDEARWRKSS